MRITPSLPPPVTVAKEGLEVKELAGVKPAKPVQERTLPPLVVPAHVKHEAFSDLAELPERRHDPHVHGERRTYCRRVEHLPFLIELRSGIDRRRHNQREDDVTEHIDEKV